MRDSELAASIVDGDPDAIAEAYDKYADLLWSYCRSLLSDAEQAREAVLDTFVITASRLEVLRSLGRLRAWLYAVARSECLRRLRSPRVLAATAEAPKLRRAAEALSTGEQRQLRAILSAAFGGLDDAERDVMTMVWHGLDLVEVAAVLGVSRSDAYALFTRARDQLEASVGVLLMGWSERAGCPEFGEALAGHDRRLTPDLRMRLCRHIEKCSECVGRYRREMRPSLLLALSVGSLLAEGTEARAAARPAPEGLWEEVYRMTCEQNPDAIWHRLIGSRRLSFGEDGFPKVLSDSGGLLTPKVAAVATVGTVALAGAATGMMATGHHAPGNLASSSISAVAPTAGATTPVATKAGPSVHTQAQRPKGKHVKPDAAAQAKAAGAASSPSALPASGGSALPVSSAGSTAGRGASVATTSGSKASGSSGSSGSSAPSSSGSSSSGSSTGSSGGGSSAPAPAPAPAPAAGTLSVSTHNLSLVVGQSGSITLTANGGPVNWSISAPSGLLGGVSVSQSSGSLAAGQSVTITVTGTGILSAGQQLTISPGNQTITVGVSLL